MCIMETVILSHPLDNGLKNKLHIALAGHPLFPLSLSSKRCGCFARAFLLSVPIPQNKGNLQEKGELCPPIPGVANQRINRKELRDTERLYHWAHYPSGFDFWPDNKYLIKTLLLGNTSFVWLKRCIYKVYLLFGYQRPTVAFFKYYSVQ